MYNEDDLRKIILCETDYLLEMLYNQRSSNVTENEIQRQLGVIEHYYTKLRDLQGV